jgi:acetyl-CoA carboxylase carboxyltransferase component
LNRTGNRTLSRTTSSRTVLRSRLDTHSEVYAANRKASLAGLAMLDQLLAQSRSGGGEKYVVKHRQRGKLLPRERIEALLDRDSPFLELSPIAAAGTSYETGASVVTGVGVISDVECLLIASEPTVRGGSINPYTLKKTLRAMEICRQNRLPLMFLVESGGADLPKQAEIFVPGGAGFRDMTQLSAARIPTIALVFGNSTAGGAYNPAMCDYSVFVKNRAKVFLGGPPLVKMATGEESTDEELGGAEMHARVSGLADYLAVDELDALRLGRQIVANLNVPVDVREVIARIVDGSEFDEFKPAYGTSLVTGWASIHGFPIGILANAQGVLFSAESQKATQFIQLANQHDVPLLFLQNVTGYMVGKQYEQGGIIKHGAMMINAVSNSTVPHLTLQFGASYGAGNYGMCGRAYNPRFLFAWPNAKTAVMGPQQLAGVMSLVGRASAAAAGKPFDEERDAIQRAMVESQIEQESLAVFNSARMYDDGLIDPRDSRTVLGLALSAVHTAEVRGTRNFGVFRM